MIKSKVTVTWNTEGVRKKLTDAAVEVIRERVRKVRCRQHGGTAQLGPAHTKGDILEMRFPCCCEGLKEQIRQALKS